MGRINFVEEIEYGISKGVDLTTPISQMQPGFLRDAKNANLGANGGYEKRFGYLEQLDTPWTSPSNFEIRAAVEFKSHSMSSSEKIFFGKGTDGRIGYEVAGSISAISGLTGLSNSDLNRVSFAQIEDRLFAFNGDSTNMPAIIEFNAGTPYVRDLGMTTHPSTAITAGAPAAGGVLEEGSYIWTYTWAIRDATSNKLLYQTNPAPLTTVSTTAADQKVTLTIPNPSDTFSNANISKKLRIFRTVVNGTVPFLETELSPSVGATTSYTSDSVSDAELDTEQLEISNEELDDFAGEGYDKARFPVVARNRLFVISSKLNEGRFSKISQNGPMPETFPALNFYSTEGEFGSTDQVVGQGVVNGVVIILKQRSVGYLEEIGLPEITKAEDAVTYIYREMSSTVGAVSHWAQTTVLNELVFLSRDNVYATDGRQIRPIGTPIQALIKSLPYGSGKAERISMGNDTKNRRIYIQVFTDSISTKPDFTIVGDYQLYPDFRWTFYSKGDVEGTWPGIQAASFFSFRNTTDGTLDMFFGNAGLNITGNDQRGQYFMMNTGDNDNSDAIYFKLASRPYHMGQPLITKLYKHVFLLSESETEVSNLDLCASFDLDEAEELCESFSLQGSGNNWDEHNWSDDAETEEDPLIFSASERSELEYDAHRKAKFMQLIVKQLDANAPVTVFGWGLTASIFKGL